MLKGIKALVADDDEMSLDMLTTMLCSQGVLCTAVANGREALDALASHTDTDIVLLDIQMPVMNGFEVLSHCKGTKYLSDIPVIVLASDHQEKLKSLKLGADDFLAKPYSLEELELRITKLVRSRRLAQSARLAKKEFLSIASHELRTPMHQILGVAELLESKNLNNEQREFCELLKHSIVNLTGIIRDILEYAQIDHGGASIPVEPFSLRNGIQGALDSQRNAAGQRGIRLNLDIGPDVSDALNGPSSYVHKVFSILVENAVKFSSEGEVRIVIQEERLSEYGSRFSCSVSDRGIGIPAEFHEKIFEPFVQVEPSSTREYGGIGLGLAIAKRMVELMGGTIGITSEKGRGSSFSFTFCCDLQNPEEMIH
jgi:signal transduction histidine kinase